METEEEDGPKILLIVVDRYESNAKNFVETNNFDFEMRVDKEAKALENALIPSIPYKVYIRDGEVMVVDRIGDKPSFEEVVKKISEME